MSPELRKALQAWLDEVTGKTRLGEARLFGLCANVGYSQEAELKRLFAADFGEDNTTYPFNADGKDYWVDSERETHHLNPARLAWVRAQLEKAQ